MLPKETATVLIAAGLSSLDDFQAGEQRDGTIVLTWLAKEKQVSDRTIIEWESDTVPLPSGLRFSEWLQKNGGDTRKTREKETEELIAGDKAVSAVVVGLVNAMADRFKIDREVLLQETLTAAKEAVKS